MMKSPRLFFWASVVIILLLGIGIYFVEVAKKESPGTFPDLAGEVRDSDFYEPVAEGWHRIDLGAFAISLPDDFAYIQREGIDSYVGEFSNHEVKISFDFGWYSTTIYEDPNPGFTYLTDIICQQDLFLRLNNRDHRFLASFPSLPNGKKLALRSSGFLEEETIKRIILSIGFKNCEGQPFVIDVRKRLQKEFNPKNESDIILSCKACHSMSTRKMIGPGFATISKSEAMHWYFSSESSLDSSGVGIGPIIHRASFPVNFSQIEHLFYER